MKWPLFTFLAPAVFTFSAAGQTKQPQFHTYAATVEKMRVRAIDFKKNPDARSFRTRLSEGLRGGINFAGHYILVGWGCGTGCTNAAIIDGRTGSVFWPDQFANLDASYGEGYSEEQIEFRKNSRLLIIHGRPGSYRENAKILPSGDHYYEWKNDRLRLIRSEIKASK